MLLCARLLTLQKSEMSDLLVTDIGLLVMLFICSLAYSYQGHEHTRNCGDRGENVQISLVRVLDMKNIFKILVSNLRN